ncbi:MAG: lactate utilization protein [Chloroflexota bacterium]
MAGPLGTPKGEFLASVRLALGKSGDSRRRPEPPYAPLGESLSALESQAQAVWQRAEERRPALLDQLARVAALRGWKVQRALDPEEAVGYIASLASAAQTRRAVRSDQPVFGQVPVDQALQRLGIDLVTVARDETHGREAMAAADLGITGADYAVAETGSVVVLPRRGLSRLVSVLPPVHVALVRPQEVVATLDDVFLLRRLEYYRNGGDMGSYLNFITGPSRTADIEQTLVVGVHGPREVHLVLLG